MEIMRHSAACFGTHEQFLSQHWKGQRRHAPTCAVRQPRRPCLCRAKFTVVGADGASTTYDKESVTLGSSGTADIQMSGPHVAAEHAQLTQKGSRMTCTALQGDADDLMSRTYTWVNGSEIRKGVPYVVASGTKVGVGTPEVELEVLFEEPQASGSSAMFETVLRGMTAGSSDKVRQRIEESLG